MDPISNVDRLVLLLRQRLQQQARARGASTRSATSPPVADAVDKIGLQGLAALDSMDEGPLRRALIQNILTEHLGPRLINDARFQQMVERVLEAIERDRDGQALLSGAISEMRAAAR